MNWQTAQARALAVAVEVTRLMVGREIDRMMLAGMTEEQARAEINAKGDAIGEMAEAARVRALRMMMEPDAPSHTAH